MEIDVSKRTCVTEGCTKPVLARGLCIPCYGADRLLSAPPCAIEDCPDPVSSRIWCNKHYKRWKLYGDPLTVVHIQGDDEARFWSYVDRRGDDECWPWKGAKDDDGYAVFNEGGTTCRAARWAYKRFVGPIPAGLTLDHVKANGCTRRDCTNYVRHLEPVTMHENLMRSNAASAINARKTHCPQDHEYTPDNTYTSGGRRTCRICARDKQRRYLERKAARG